MYRPLNPLRAASAIGLRLQDGDAESQTRNTMKEGMPKPSAITILIPRRPLLCAA